MGLPKPQVKLAFIKICNKYGDKALPILSKIKDKKLSLTDYTLNKNQCKALSEIMKLEPQIL
jgi:hypothetical protein